MLTVGLSLLLLLFSLLLNISLFSFSVLTIIALSVSPRRLLVRYKQGDKISKIKFIVYRYTDEKNVHLWDYEAKRQEKQV